MYSVIRDAINAKFFAGPTTAGGYIIGNLAKEFFDGDLIKESRFWRYRNANFAG
jgi:hypothetical protein